jgi:hypothetical protein
LSGSLQREKPAERMGVPSHDRRRGDEPQLSIRDRELHEIATDEILANDAERNEEMKIDFDYWKPRVGILFVGSLSILNGVIDIVSKHAGGGIRDEYFGTNAVVIGIVFVVAGVICVIVEFRKKASTPER